MTKIEDIARLAIEEVNAELEENVAPKSVSEPAPSVVPAPNAEEQKENSGALIENERIFLANVKERLGVLFEGLNAGGENTELRLDLTIKFLEFLLANVENRLKNLPK